MIIQCDQCKTKFKLDDAKVPDKGIKVRCAKCKQVFMAQRETAPEEPDLDFLLSGLGTQAPDAGAPSSQVDLTVAAATPEQEWRMPEQGAVAAEGAVPAEPPAGYDSERAPGDEYDKGLFTAAEEPAAPEAPKSDYGEFSFDEEETKALSDEEELTATASVSTNEFEFGEFPFDTESKEQTGTVSALEDVTEGTARFEFQTEDFSADELMQTGKEGDSGDIAAEKPLKEEFAFGAEQETPQEVGQIVEATPPPLADAGESFDFGELAAQPEELKGVEIPPVITTDEPKEVVNETTDSDSFEFGEVAVAAPEVTKEGERKADFDFKSVSVEESVPTPAFSAQMPAPEDELPPLAISTRKKGRSIFSIIVTSIIVLIVLAIAGMGIYVFKTGPAAFNKLGISFLAKWAGLEAVEEGGITIKDPQGAFMVNREAGEIFVVKGEAVNNFKSPRASIQVRANVLGPKGEILAQKTAYCGNFLSQEQLASLPMAKIEEAMASPFGDSLMNLGVQPGKAIPFVVVFSGVQKNAAEFSVEVVGSTVAGQ